MNKEKERILNGLKQAVYEVNEMLAGRKEMKDVETFLKEIEPCNGSAKVKRSHLNGRRSRSLKDK